MAWHRRFQNIRQRDWPDVLSNWSDLGKDFDSKTFLDFSLEDVLAGIQPEQIRGNNITTFELDDRKAVTAELVYSQIKACHSLDSALSHVSRGAASWGVIDTYHSSLLLTKAIMAAFGIFILRIHERNVIVDVFPWLGKPEDQKRFKRENKNWRDTVAVISSETKLIEQSDIFDLFQRVLRISTVPTDLWPEHIVKSIIEADKSDFSGARNGLLYGSRFWFNTSDILTRCLSMNWSLQERVDIQSFSFEKESDPSEVDYYLDAWVLFAMSKKLQQQIYDAIGDTLGVFDHFNCETASSLVSGQFSNQL
jgi:hypothetical protein